MSVKEVLNMEQRMGGRDFSLQTPIGSSDEGEKSTFEDMTEDETPNAEENVIARNEHNYRMKLAKSFLDQLTDRERAIIINRICMEKPKMLEVLSQEFGVSRERIRQIEAAALKKVQGFAADMQH